MSQIGEMIMLAFLSAFASIAIVLAICKILELGESEEDSSKTPNSISKTSGVI